MSKAISATIPFLLASMAIMGQLAIAEDYPLRPMTVFGTTPAGTSVVEPAASGSDDYLTEPASRPCTK